MAICQVITNPPATDAQKTPRGQTAARFLPPQLKSTHGGSLPSSRANRITKHREATVMNRLSEDHKEGRASGPVSAASIYLCVRATVSARRSFLCQTIIKFLSGFGRSRVVFIAPVPLWVFSETILLHRFIAGCRSLLPLLGKWPKTGIRFSHVTERDMSQRPFDSGGSVKRDVVMYNSFYQHVSFGEVRPRGLSLGIIHNTLHQSLWAKLEFRHEIATKWNNSCLSCYPIRPPHHFRNQFHTKL